MALRHLKPFIPNLLWVGARRAKSCVNRIRAWRSVLKHVSGFSPRDEEVVHRSARHGIRASFSDLDQWMDPVLVDDARVEVRNVGRFDIRAATDDLYHVLPSREPAILNAVLDLKAGDLFVDAGANIGFYSIAAAKKVGRAGRVIAIEMLPATAAVLRGHLELNECGNVEVVEKALSDRSGQRVEAVVPTGKFGQASIARSASADNELVRVKVGTITLDQLLDGERRTVALMKLDLEGAELAALEGATETLKRTKAVIYEALEDSHKVRTLLQCAGFQLRRLDGNNWIAERS